MNILLYSVKPEITPPGWEHETVCTRNPKKLLQDIRKWWLEEANDNDNPRAAKISDRFTVQITVEWITLKEWHAQKKFNEE